MSLYLPLYLRDRHWRISYSSNENNPIADFYIPALECTTQYDRKSGFFSSAILSKVARGLGAMLQNQGQIRLIMGCQFSPQDLQAIQQGYTLRDTLLTRLDANLKPPETFTQLKHFEILSWLIQNSYLDIKIAIPVKDNDFPIDSQPLTINSQSLAPNHYYIFHEKVGIFTDKNGDKIAFSGSNNESLNGWENNTESFHVYCSWEGGRDLERVAEEQFRFEQLWNDLAPNVRIFDVPEAIKKKLLHYAPTTKPTWNHQAELDARLLTANNQPLTTNNQAINPEEKQAFQSLINLYKHPGCLDFCLKSIPIKPWPHQIKILRRVGQQFPRSFLIADEVGLGKTIETGLILRYLLISQKVKRVLILSPASIQPQWQEELREKFNLHFWSYSQNQFIPANNCQSTVKNQSLSNPWNTHNLILASSHLVRRAERMGELLAAEPWDLIILDEAHHARRKSPQNRKETPNRLLQLMQQLRAKTRSLMLLSATPMQIDTIEIFDLLNLLGLQGHWLYGENFCNYFASLSEQPDRFSLDFLQQMSTDYFQNGGLSCPRFDEYLTKNDRLISYRLRDIWQKGQRISNPKYCIEDQAFITASRQYLTINNPLKDLMFRHTRDTLREYYRHGLLDREIPERKVQDNAITLEPNREIPLYRAVSDYVRHFYKLAQKEHRKALGFLMTLYRKRLTSSFYAIKESLQRRLDGINITPDDLGDLEDADDPIIEGLESYFEPVDPQEIQYLENLLQQFANTGEDSKLSHFITILRQELIERESAIAFTPQALEQLLTNSQVVKQAGAIFKRLDPQTWQLNYQGKTYQVTFSPETFDEKPSLQYMNFGNPLFEQIISQSHQ